MYWAIKDVKPVNDYILHLTFGNGEISSQKVSWDASSRARRTFGLYSVSPKQIAETLARFQTIENHWRNVQICTTGCTKEHILAKQSIP